MVLYPLWNPVVSLKSTHICCALSRCAQNCTESVGGIRPHFQNSEGGTEMVNTLRNLWRNEEGQDIAEYAVMLAVILVIVVGTIRLIGSNANNVFSSVASSVQ
jgi:Flp pilus assembly pilin Flp